jgi:hypothetical protein
MPSYYKDLLRYFPAQTLPLAMLDEQGLDRVLAKVGQRFVPKDLDRTGLRDAIARAVESKENIDRYRGGKRSRAVRESLQRIRQKAEELDACLRENNDAMRMIEKLQPSASEDVIRILCTAGGLEQALGESNERVISRYARRIPTSNEWLAGVELPLVFEDFFHRKAGLSQSRSKHKHSGRRAPPSGPTVRFVSAVMIETGTPFANGSIGRAMTALAKIRDSRRAVRHNTGQN